MGEWTLARRGALSRRLVDWYRKSHRDLPWRRTDDPYRIWLSETMLQQTRVETVVPYYERFVARFPDVAALADADEQEVLLEWAGLGYYSRARNLKRAAEVVVRDHGGELPRTAEHLGALPGIGRYTAGAIRSIAFREPAPIVDGNVRRVISRLLGLRRPSETELWARAEELVQVERPDLLNQALMELGARVCTPRAPGCATCPVRGLCAARAAGDPEAYPARAPKRRPREVSAVSGVVERGGRVPALLMMRRPSRGLLGGTWEIPTIDGGSIEALVESLRVRFGLRTRDAGRIGRVHHTFTHRALTLDVFRLEREGGRLRPARGAGEGEVRWCSAAERARLPLSTLMRKTLQLAGLG